MWVWSGTKFDIASRSARFPTCGGVRCKFSFSSLLIVCSVDEALLHPSTLRRDDGEVVVVCLDVMAGETKAKECTVNTL